LNKKGKEKEGTGEKGNRGKREKGNRGKREQIPSKGIRSRFPLFPFSLFPFSPVPSFLF